MIFLVKRTYQILIHYIVFLESGLTIDIAVTYCEGILPSKCSIKLCNLYYVFQNLIHISNQN